MSTYTSFEAAEQACREQGLTPFRLEFEHLCRGAAAAGQVQSVETHGPGTFNHPRFEATVVSAEEAV